MHRLYRLLQPSRRIGHGRQLGYSWLLTSQCSCLDLATIKGVNEDYFVQPRVLDITELAHAQEQAIHDLNSRKLNGDTRRRENGDLLRKQQCDS